MDQFGLNGFCRLLLLVNIFFICNGRQYQHIYPCTGLNCKELYIFNKFQTEKPSFSSHKPQRYLQSDIQRRKRNNASYRNSKIKRVKNNGGWKNRKATSTKIGTSTGIATRQETCKGYENFIHDIEIAALLMTTVSYTKALVALVLHVLNQLYIFFSVFLVGTPERGTWLIEQIRPGTIEENLHTAIEWIGFLDYLVIRWVSFPTGNLIVIIGVIAHIIGGIALGIDWIVPFKDVFRTMVLGVTGVDLEVVFDGYGCNNPFEQTFSSAFQSMVTQAVTTQ